MCLGELRRLRGAQCCAIVLDMLQNQCASNIIPNIKVFNVQAMNITCPDTPWRIVINNAGHTAALITILNPDTPLIYKSDLVAFEASGGRVCSQAEPVWY